MKFSAPGESIPIGSLLTAAAQGGFDPGPLERLLWLMNAHPQLISHAQIFAHIGAHLASPTFAKENLDWAGNWKDDISQWKSICGWISKNISQLLALPGLSQFAAHNPARHPIMKHGVVRHGVISALWNRHQDTSSYPPHGSTAAAMGYFRLQGHLFGAFMESRSRTSNLNFYRAYAGQAEMPRAPVRTAAVGVAVRNFSLAAFSPVMVQLPHSHTTPEFAGDLNRINLSTVELAADHVDPAHSYFSVVCRYFQLICVQLAGWYPPQNTRLRTGGGGGGGHKSHHGFVNLSGIEGVYFGPRQPVEEDPDVPALPSQTISYGHKRRVEANEQAGDSPTEALRTFFPLIPNEEKSLELYKERLQKAAIESAAQNFGFAYQNLSPEEARRMNDRACLEIILYLEHEAPLSEEIRCNAITGILIRTMLCLGQSLDSSLALSCHFLTDIGQVAAFTPISATLLILQEPNCPLEGATVVGFCLPAITPSYKSQISPNLEDANTATSLSFVLPDCLGLGRQLLGYLIKEVTTSFDSFHTDSKVVKKAIREMSGTLGLDRVTPTKLSRFLQNTIIEQTGDQTLAWTLTASQQHSNEPRMFYTRYRISRIVQAYEKACKRMAKIFGHPTMAVDSLLNSRTDEWVGSRFVVQFDVLKRCIADLQEHLDQRFQSRNRNQQRNYHQRYLIYTILYQSIMTAYRAVNNPLQVYREWERAKGQSELLVVSLSDKDSVYLENARLAIIPKPLAAQFDHFARHIANLEKTFPAILLSPLRDPLTAEVIPFFTLSADAYKLGLVDVTWLTLALKGISGVPLPPNFQRGFLRTELLDRGCPPEVIDAFMGHANQGEVPFAGLSTFDYQQYINTINRYLLEIHDDLGLRPIPSRLVAPQDRKKSA